MTGGTLRNSLLPAPPEAEIAADLLSEAVDALLAGDEGAAREKLSQADMQVLFRHARGLMDRKDRSLFPPRVKRAKGPREELRMPPPEEINFIYVRDGWRCRFCNCRVVQKKALSHLRKLLPDAIKWFTHKDDHGAFLALLATPDHVVPHSAGGTSGADNIVTSCWPCNFAKKDDTVEHLGLSDPRLRAPIVDGWDGLMRVLAVKPPRGNRVKKITIMQNELSAKPTKTKKPKYTLKESTPESVAIWSAKMNDMAPQIADRLIEFAESCATVGVSYIIRKTLRLRITIDSGDVFPIGIDPATGVEIPWSIGPYKSASKNFAITMSEALPDGDFYDAGKMWTARILVAE